MEVKDEKREDVDQIEVDTSTIQTSDLSEQEVKDVKY